MESNMMQDDGIIDRTSHILGPYKGFSWEWGAGGGGLQVVVSLQG